jgi:TonB family protein
VIETASSRISMTTSNAQIGHSGTISPGAMVEPHSNTDTISIPLLTEVIPSEHEKILQVAHYWGTQLIEVKQFNIGTHVTIGTSKEAAFFLNALDSDFQLVTLSEKTNTMAVPSAGMLKLQNRITGEVEANPAGAFELARHQRAHISFHLSSLVIQFVSKSELAKTSFVESDFSFFKLASLCALVFFSLAASFALTPFRNGSEGDDFFNQNVKQLKVQVIPEKPAHKPKLNPMDAATGAMGKRGKIDARNKVATSTKPAANKTEMDRNKVDNLLKIMMGAGAASEVFSKVGLNDSIGAATASLVPGNDTASNGTMGMGPRGENTSGGGHNLSVGHIGVKGGTGNNHGIEFGTKKQTHHVSGGGKTTVIGGLDKDVIMKVISRHQNEIKFCYEQELQKNAALAGKVALNWTIDSSGSVIDATVAESSIENQNVESCIAQKVRRWKFPEPQGGGVVSVTFPWLFSAAGDVEE